MKKLVLAPIMFLSLITLSSCDIFAKEVSVDAWLNLATSCKDTTYKSASVKIVTTQKGNKETRKEEWNCSDGYWSGPSTSYSIYPPGTRAIDFTSTFLDYSYEENYSMKFYSNMKVEYTTDSKIKYEYKFNSYGYLTSYKFEFLNSSYGIFNVHDGVTITISYNPLW